MKATAAIALTLCMIPAVCIVVWIGLHFAKRHIQSKSAMSKAYYRRAREGIPNTTDVELGPLANRYTVQLAPYRYVKRNHETGFVRPSRDQRARRTRMNIRGTNYHVTERRGSSRKTGSAKPNHGSNRAQRDWEMSKKEREKQRRQQQKKTAKKKHKKEKEEKKEQDNYWNSGPQSAQKSNEDPWGKPSSKGGSNAEGQSKQQSEQGQPDVFQKLGVWDTVGTEENNQQNGNDRSQNGEDQHSASHHGSREHHAGWSDLPMNNDKQSDGDW